MVGALTTDTGVVNPPEMEGLVEQNRYDLRPLTA